MGSPSPELSNLWLARAFNAQDVEAAAALYHPDASIVQIDEVHGGTTIAHSGDPDAARPWLPTSASSRTWTWSPIIRPSLELRHDPITIVIFF